MKKLLKRYAELLNEVDGWFNRSLAEHQDLILCGRGCSACCRGFFDITLLDAVYLRFGFENLPPDVKKMLQQKAVVSLDKISLNVPAFQHPWIFNEIPETEWETIMPENDETPCLLLSDDGLCRLYDYRPMTCRLNGIPLFDIFGEELSDEYCTLNFKGSDPATIKDIYYPFKELFAQELLLFRELTKRLFSNPVNEIDTLIPAALIVDKWRKI